MASPMVLMFYIFQYSRRRRKEKQERKRDTVRRNPTSSPQLWPSPASSLCTVEPSVNRKTDLLLRNQCRRLVLLIRFPNPVYKLWEPYYFIVFTVTEWPYLKIPFS